MVKRKSFQGTTTTTIDCRGYEFALVQGGYQITVGQVGFSTGHYNGRFYLGGATSLIIKAFSDGSSWNVTLYEKAPALNQTELCVSLMDSGGYYITGDDDVLYRAQDVDLPTVNIADVPINLDGLAQLFQQAIATKTLKDAARYTKMRSAVMAYRN